MKEPNRRNRLISQSQSLAAPRKVRQIIRAIVGISAGLIAMASLIALPAQNVVTYKYDNSRDGLNTNESALTLTSVNVTDFARLFTYPVDGYVYAQPLYVSGVTIPGQGTHNVVYVATENDSLYAFDADSNTGPNGGLLWHTNLGIALISTFYGVRYHHNVLNPLIGITGTPVIDPVSGTLYVDAFSGVVSNTASGFHTLHALNIATGAEQPNSPVLVNASVPGQGVDATNGVVKFAPQSHMNRPAMTLVGNTLYAAYGSYGDTDPFHGWVIGFNASTLQQLTNYVFATTPNATISAFGTNAGEGALWMGGDGLCVDSSNNLYFESGNGSFSAITNGGDYGDSFVKLSSTNGLTVADYFTPANQGSMALNDNDLGSGGPILLPDAAGSASHPHLMIGAGKEGTLYLVDRDNLGQYTAGDANLVQELHTAIGGLFGSGAYFNNTLYFQGTSDVMKAYRITNAVMSTSPISMSTTTLGYLGYTPVITANGTNNAIVWVIQADAYANNGPAVLRAYNATNLAQELYDSNQNLARDNPGPAIKYSVPVVVNGKVYVGTEYGLSVFGVGTFLPAPTIAPNGGIFTNSVTVTLSNATPGTTIYYTLNGTTPTTNSYLYTAPFVLTNSSGVSAFAVKPGAFSSPVATASFINSSAIGSGVGLLGKYWPNTSSTAFTNLSFGAPPTLVRTDATVNFNWANTGPDPSIGASNYAVRWTGTIQPQFSEPYTFYTAADDGVRLFINGQLLINDWNNQAPTTESNTISLAAQQLYNLQLDYYYKGDNGAQVSVSWSSPSTPQSLIPQSQLYPYTNPPPVVMISNPADGSIYTAVASVSIAAQADAQYNPIQKVDFYANGSLVGTLNNSLTAPLYALTTTGFVPNPGGETGNSAQASATPNLATLLTTTNVQAQGSDWTAAIWQTNGSGTTVMATASSQCALVFNGITIGNGSNNTRIRSPAVGGAVTFPGASLTVNTNTEFRTKGTTPSTVNLPGVGGNPGLILNGGMLNNGDNTANSIATITGSIQVASQSYNSAQGANGGGGGLAASPRAIDFAGYLSGSGNLVIMNCSTNLPQVVSGSSNTYSGQWIVQCGWLQGATATSLGTNSITIDPLYNGYLAAMPNATSPNGPALFEANYDITSAGTLTLRNGGLMNLHQNCTFGAVNIEGTLLNTGTHSYSELSGRFPNNFIAGGSGSITVSPVSYGAPLPTQPPAGLKAIAGNNSVTLTWNPSLGATNYSVKRATASGGPYTPVAGLSGTTYTDTGLINGTTYYYVVTAMSAAGYALTAVATDGSGLGSASAPVHIVVNAGSGLPYGLASNSAVPPFLNMPTAAPPTYPGNLPAVLSGTGAYIDTPNRVPATGLIPYVPNTPLWSDAAVKSRYMALPNNGGLMTPDQQIAFLPTNTWTFPAGTVFVKNFDLVVNETNSSAPLRRLETRLLVRDVYGAVYGVTYKWRPDNSDADILTTSLNESVLITNATGIRTQIWYYPSPADCLTCHTPVANYVLGVNTRQLNGNKTYAATGNSDNQLRALNRLGLFLPAINEANIPGYPQLTSLTNVIASLEQRSRSYLDANCAQCHQPGGLGITFDARYDTPLPNQNITNYPAQLTLGFDNACIVKDKDIWRSMLLFRINDTDPASQMPPIARNLIDTNAVQVLTDWINSLPGTPALAPPVITPNGGVFSKSVSVTLTPPDTNATLYYTLNGTLPTTNSFLYSGPVVLTNSATFMANAFQLGFNNSVAATAAFTIQSLQLAPVSFNAGQGFQLQVSGAAGGAYVLQASTDLTHWTDLLTNIATTNFFNLSDPGASNYPYRFYRVLEQ
jgi:mono/diheme cytochrome c family protein